MNGLPYVLETALPMDIVGWGSLALGLVIVVLWLVYLYR